jgi:type II secretory pathway component PulF
MSEDPIAVRHSLLRLLAVADRHSLDVHRAVELFSQEHWGLHQWRLKGLLRSLRKGTSPMQALAKDPSWVGEQAMLALRLGHATGTLPSAWEELKGWERPVHTEAAKLWRNSKAYWSTVALVMMLVFIFFAWRIAPLFRSVVQEFQLESLEGSFVVQELDTIIFGVLAGFPVFVVFWIAWRAATWHPKSWLRHFTARGRGEKAMRKAGIWRLLAMNLASGVCVKTSIEHLASLHEDVRLRQKLSIANESIAKGTDEWQSLVNAKLLHPIERDAVTATDKPEVQAWTLRHLALRRRENLHFGALGRNMWVQPVITLLFGSFVLAIAYAVFATFSQMILVMAERHG